MSSFPYSNTLNLMIADLVTVRPAEVWRGMMINLISVLSKECGENLTKCLSGQAGQVQQSAVEEDKETSV